MGSPPFLFHGRMPRAALGELFGKFEFPDLGKGRGVGIDRKLALFVVRHRAFLDDVEVISVQRLSLVERKLYGKVENIAHRVFVLGGTIGDNVGLARFVDQDGEFVYSCIITDITARKKLVEKCE